MPVDLSDSRTVFDGSQSDPLSSAVWRGTSLSGATHKFARAILLPETLGLGTGDDMRGLGMSAEGLVEVGTGESVEVGGPSVGTGDTVEVGDAKGMTVVSGVAVPPACPKAVCINSGKNPPYTPISIRRT